MVLDDVRVVQLFEDRYFFADLFNDHIIRRFFSIRISTHRFIITLELLRCHVKVRQRDLFHSILILAFLHQVDRPVCTLADQVEHFESIHILITRSSQTPLNKPSHLLQILPNLQQLLLRQPLIELLKKRDIRQKFLVIVAHVDKSAVDLCWEDYFKSFAVFLN